MRRAWLLRGDRRFKDDRVFDRGSLVSAIRVTSASVAIH
jgi:hypothetical protein